MGTHQFAICIDNREADDLELLKLYQIIPDHCAEEEQYMCVIDESGGDYLYPAAWFAVVSLSGQTEAAILPLFSATHRLQA